MEYSGSMNAESSLSSDSFELNLLFEPCGDGISNLFVFSRRGEEVLLEIRAHGKVRDDIVNNLLGMKTQRIFDGVLVSTYFFGVPIQCF